MAKSKRKKKQEVRDEQDAKKFWQIVGISTLVLIILLFFLFSGMS